MRMRRRISEQPAQTVIVGAGLPANRPGLLANIAWTFTVAGTTAFAGKPAPTTGVVATHPRTREQAGPAGQYRTGVHRCRHQRIRGAAHTVGVGAGLPANRPGLLANIAWTFTVAGTTAFAGKPAPTTGVVATHPRTREQAGPAGQYRTGVHRCRHQRIRGAAHTVGVGAGLPANRPGLLANIAWAFTVAGTNAFAGRHTPSV